MRRVGEISRIWGKSASLVALFSLAVACGGSMKDARRMSSAERRVIVARPVPDKVPTIDGIDSIGARVRIDASPAKVWQVLAVGFGDVDDWAGAGVAESECTSDNQEGLGAVRSCRIAKHMPIVGGDFYEEKITGWQPRLGYFSVMQTRATGPTDIVIAENWISSDGEGGTVVTTIVHVDFHFLPTLFGGPSKLKRKVVEGMIGLKHYCETGERVIKANWKEVVRTYPQILKDNKV